MGDDEARDGGDQLLEERIQGLAEEIAGLIDGAAPETRADLRSLAVNLLHERAEESQIPRVLPASSSPARFNPLGIAIPLLLVGLLLVALFPPVGLLILLFAVLMFLWGLLAAVRLR